MNAKWFKLVLFFAVLTILVACANPTPMVIEKTVIVEKEKLVTPTPAELTEIDVPLGWLNNDEFTPLQVADKKGFFAKRGLKVNLVSGGGSTGFDPIVAINGFDNNVRISVPAALSLVLKAYSEGVDVVAVFALTQYEPSGFLTLIKDGRRAQSPCDFEGRIVGMQTEGMWMVDALGAVCDKKPLKSGTDFTVIPAGWDPSCLDAEQCDYYCGWSTNQVFFYAQQGLQEGVDYEMFMTADFLPFYFADVVITTHAFLKENPEMVRAFVEAAAEGTNYTLQNPEEAIKITSSVPGVSAEHAAWRIPMQNRLVTSDDTKVNGVGYMDLTKVQAMIDFLFEHGQIAKSFKAEEVVFNDFIPKP